MPGEHGEEHCREEAGSIAEQGFSGVIERSPEDMEAMLFLGVALMNQADYEGAIARLNIVKSRVPKLPTVYLALIDAYIRSGDMAGAVCGVFDG